MLNFKEIFIKTLGEPISTSALDLYINFVIESTNNINDNERIEIHHLLPSSCFEEYIKNDDNLFPLSYKNHVLAHIHLTSAYKIKKFLRPLNFMINREEKNSIEYTKKWSTACKESWVRFKKTSKYKIFVEKRSAYMTKYMRECGGRLLSLRQYDTPEKSSKRRENISNQFKELWKDKDYRERVINSMIKEKSTPEAKERMSKSMRTYYDNRSEEEIKERCNRAKIVNGNEEKRLKSGMKIKEKWKDEDFQNKMKIRDENRTGSKWVYNIETHETKLLFKGDEIEDGWLYGRDKEIFNTPEAKQNYKNRVRVRSKNSIIGKKLCLNLITNKKKFLYPEEIVGEWVITTRKQ